MSLVDARAALYAGFDAHPWGHGKRYWTQERSLGELRRLVTEIKGPLPSNYDAYCKAKKGHLWPPASRLTEYFNSIPRAWLAAGVTRSRLTVKSKHWTKAEIAFLLEHAGTLRLTDIARRLNRSYSSVRSKLGGAKGGMGLRAREASGYLTGLALAKEYGCSYARVQRLLAEGVLRATYHERLHCWHIDPADAEKVRHLLTAPKRTYTTTPPDIGNYREKYGIRRLTVHQGANPIEAVS